MKRNCKDVAHLVLMNQLINFHYLMLVLPVKNLMIPIKPFPGLLPSSLSICQVKITQCLVCEVAHFAILEKSPFRGTKRYALLVVSFGPCKSHLQKVYLPAQ